MYYIKQHQHANSSNYKMKSIQMILAVFVIAALCGIVTSSDSDDSDYGYKRRSGYCTNKGCRSGYIYYGRNGDCKYGNKSWRYNCNSYVGCCLPRNPNSKYYCTNKYGCGGNYYYYNNKGYFYYTKNDYYNCKSYKGCCLRNVYYRG